MNILVFCGSYYPYMNPPATCLDKYLQELKKSHHIDIVCPCTHIPVQKPKDIGIDIHFISTPRNTIKAICRSHIEKGHRLWFYKPIYNLMLALGRLISYISYPSRESWMIRKYLRVAENLQKLESVDAVISVSFPICTHFAAYYLKVKNPELKWITYSTDPFAMNENASFKYSFFKEKRKKKNFMWEEKYLKAADYNIFTEELFEASILKFSLDPRRSFAFPFTIKPPEKILADDVLHTIKPKVVYAGNLYYKIRNPQKMLEVLSLIKEVETFLFQTGDCDRILSAYNNCDNIHINGLLTKDKYLHVVNDEADIHINIGNNVPLQAPSKMVQLISTGKPILNFYSVWNSQCEMIEKYPLGMNIGPDFYDIEAVRSFCLQNCHKYIEYNEIETIFPDNCFEKQMASLDDMLMC